MIIYTPNTLILLLPAPAPPPPPRHSHHPVIKKERCDIYTLLKYEVPESPGTRFFISASSKSHKTTTFWKIQDPRCYSCKEDKLGKENSLQRDLAWTQLHMSQSPQDINWEGYRKQKLSHARNELICTWHKPSEQCATDWDLTKGIHKMISGLDSLTTTITFWMKEHPVVQSQNECAELQWKPVRFLSV